MTGRKTALQLALLGGEAVIFIASGIALYVVISRIAGPDLLGQYSLVLSWMLIFQAIGNFGIPELMMRELGRFGDRRGEYLGAGFLLGLTSSFGLAIVMMTASQFTNYDRELRIALTIAALSLPGAMLVSVARSGFISCRCTGFILTTRVVEFLAVLPLNLVLIARGHGVVSLITVLVAGRAAASVLALFLLHRHTVPVVWWPGTRYLRSLLSPAAVFAASNAVGVAGMHINVILLSLMAPVAAVGYYVAGFKLVEGMALVSVLFGQFYMPQVAASLNEQRAAGLAPFREAFRLLFAIIIPAGMGLALFSGIFVETLYGPEFDETKVVLRIMGLFYLLYCVDGLMSMVLKAASLQSLDLEVLTLSVVVTVLATFVLIPVLGAVGAALGLLCGSLCSVSLRYRSICVEIGSPGWVRLAAPLLVLSTAVGTVIALLDGTIPDWIQIVIYAVPMLALLGWVARTAGVAAVRAGSELEKAR